MPKNFLLGVGCQKGGTSWLHDYLVQNDAVNFGVEKEYHVFDALNIDSCRHFIQASRRQFWLQPWKPWPRKKLSFYRNVENYFDYFDQLQHQCPDTSLVGDITPSYAGLDRRTYSQIKQALSRRGFNIKVLFIMREPYERVWSHVRMLRNLKTRVNQDSKQMVSESEQLKNSFALPEVEMRTRYDLTIQNLEAVFDQEELYYCFYENLFEETTIASLTEFLEIPYVQADFATKVHSSSKSPEIDLAVLSEVARYYAQTYHYIAEKFGTNLVNSYWPTTGKLLTDRTHSLPEMEPEMEPEVEPERGQTGN